MLNSNPATGDAVRPPAEQGEFARQTIPLSVVTNDRAAALEKSARAAYDGHRRMVEEIGPIAHALQGLLDIMGAEDAGFAGADSTQFRLLRNWTRDLVRAVRRHQEATAQPLVVRADIGEIVDDAVALFRDRCDARGHTVVFSGPPEPALVRIDPQRLESAIRQLMESVFDREARDRRIDIVLWRSIEECRLAFVSGPPVRRGFETAEDPPAPPVRSAGPADARFVGALAQLRELGAFVETNCDAAFGSSLLVSLPVA
jgi:hypothetical protein